MADDVRKYPHAYFRRKRTEQDAPGPTLARLVIEKWKDGWCCTRRSKIEQGTLDEGMEFLNNTTYEEVYFSPSSQQWEAVDGH